MQRVCGSMPKMIAGLALLLLLGQGGMVLPAAAADRPVSQQEYELFTQARRYVENKALGRAEALLGNYFERREDGHAYAYELYGYVLLHQGKAEQAVRVLEKGFALYPHNATIAQNLGSACAGLGRHDKAAEAFMAAYVLSGETRPQLAYSAALFLLRSERFDRAEDILRPLVARPEAKAEWFLLLAQCLVRQDKKQAALDTLELAVKRFPEDSRLWRMLGFAHYRQGNGKEAAAAYEISHRLKPPSPKEASQLAALYCSLGASLLGEKRAQAGEDSPRMRDTLAHGLARSGDLTGALLQAEEALRMEPTPERHFRKGQILLRMRRMEEARSEFALLAGKEGALQAKALWMLAMISWAEGDWRTASTFLEQAGQMDEGVRRRSQGLLSVLSTMASGG